MKKTEKEILEEVIRIEFNVRKIMSGLNLGVKNSTFKGQGMTFSDIRSYEPGDDIRHLAWQVMARTGEPYIKQFEEERDLEVHVAVDIGESMEFGGKKKSKALIQAYVLAFLGLSTSRSKDKFGGIIFSNSRVKRVPALRGDNHVRRFLFSYLEAFNEKKDILSDTEIALDYFSKIKAKNSLCILISDFAKPLNRKLLAQVKSKHKVKIIQIFDPYEQEFPKVGWLLGKSIKAANGLNLFKSGRSLNFELNNSFLKRVAVIEKISKSFGIDFIQQSTHDEDLNEITKNLKLRSVYG